MQFQSTPQFIVKSFKRHFYKVKEVGEQLAKSDGSLKFEYTYEKGTVQTKIETPNDDATIRLVVLMRRYLNPESLLFYKRVWNLLKEHFSDAIPADFAAQLEQFMERLNKGSFSLIVNQQEVTAENIYHIVANGEYFGKTDEEATAFLKSISDMPVGPFLLHQFYSYNFDLANLASMLFSIMVEIERSEQYSSMFQEEPTTDKRCIYCLSETGIFTSEEHIFPESLGNYDTVLPKGFVCDKCNNEVLSGLDAELVDSDLISLLKTLFTPYTKGGKLPQTTYPNMKVKKTYPSHIVIETKSKKNFTVDKIDENGIVHFTIKTTGRKKFDPKLLGRALYKIGLGMVAFHEGKENVCHSRYDAARAFILRGKDFPNNLLISRKMKPHPNIASTFEIRWGGTWFQLDIYGVIFFFNLETTPIIEPTKEQLEEINFISFPLCSEAD